MAIILFASYQSCIHFKFIVNHLVAEVLEEAL
jgi:hypothetical protein